MAGLPVLFPGRDKGRQAAHGTQIEGRHDAHGTRETAHGTETRGREDAHDTQIEGRHDAHGTREAAMAPKPGEEKLPMAGGTLVRRTCRLSGNRAIELE
jgi:hypothetical protein